VESGDAPEQRGLTRAVRADEAREGALEDVQGDVVDSSDRPERLRDAGELACELRFRLTCERGRNDPHRFRLPATQTDH
jgi:hypothetical protein